MWAQAAHPRGLGIGIWGGSLAWQVLPRIGFAFAVSDAD